MLWIDIKYASLLSARLDRFKVKNNNPYTATFRCPLCGDSDKNKTKTRGYLFIAYQKLRMKCHNCGASYNFNNFLEKLDGELFSQYTYERYKANNPHEEREIVPDSTAPFETPDPRLIDGILDRLDTLSVDHPARAYCVSRMIPDAALSRLYYIDDVSKIGQLKDSYKEKISGTEARLVFPFYNRLGLLNGLTMRALGDHKLRYVTIRLNENEPMIYNLDAIDFLEQVYCVEGPIDSLFLPNCVAIGGSDMRSIRKMLPKSTIYVFDNQPRNKEICALINKQILSGYRVCLFPDNIEEKDINEMVMAGHNVRDIIYNNSFSGLEAELKFAKWRKV
jgi:transcription elongation factor Elf1